MIKYNGRQYYLDKDGYYRAGRWLGVKVLHEQMWIDANGPIPPGHVVAHMGSRKDNSLSNLICDTPQNLAGKLNRRQSRNMAHGL